VELISFLLHRGETTGHQLMEVDTRPTTYVISDHMHTRVSHASKNAVITIEFISFSTFHFRKFKSYVFRYLSLLSKQLKLGVYQTALDQLSYTSTTRNIGMVTW
jgi:hypothetical protein